MKITLAVLCNLIFVNLLLCQSTIVGKVLDGDTQEPLIGASIFCDDDGTVTEIDGTFSLKVLGGCIPSISYVGYSTIEIKEINSEGVYLLYPNSQSLDMMIVTGSKYERRLSESTVSIEVIKPNLLKAVNTIKGDDILNKLPGVQVVGGQANIRGGSGFSYGAGSRVMVLIDGLPALQSDAGYANWGDLPIEAIDQIEVLKGAASSLYGSAAMNGIVNFRRKKATSTPSTSAFVSYTQYLDPAVPISKWWTETRYRANVGINHTRKIGALDINAYGFYGKLESYAQDTYEDKGRLGLDLKYHINEKLKIGINTLVNYNEAQDYFLWDNDLRGLYKPFPGTLSSGRRTRYIIDPSVEYSDNFGNDHKLQMRYYSINNKNEFNRSNTSSNTFGEYQYQRNLAKIETILTGGMVTSFTNTSAELYGDTTFTYTNYAAYIQGEKRWGRWTFAAGTRYEYNIKKSPEVFAGVQIPNGQITDDAIVSRLGLNYKVNKFTSIRSSWGQGYRFPSISERFIETNFGGFNVFPNPTLLSERGWTAEVGLKQGISLGGFKGFVDLAGFTSRYNDMIEFSFLSDPLGFMPINVGDTEITGAEVSISGEGKLGDQTTLRILTGYTYINPFYRNFEDRPEIKDNLSTSQNVLKYRSKHSAKIDAELQWKFIKLGLSIQHYSHMINIDKRLETPFDGVDLVKIQAFRNKYNNGYQIFDLRLGAELKPFNINFILSNVLNEVYTIRPGLLEAPRNITLRLDYTIN